MLIFSRASLSGLVVLLFSLTLAVEAEAQAKKPMPPKLPDFTKPTNVEFAGKVSSVQQAGLVTVNFANQPIMILINPQVTSNLFIKGTAEPDGLKPKMNLRFTGKVNEKGEVEGEVAAAEIFTPLPIDEGTDLKAGEEVLISGSLFKSKDGEFQMGVKGKGIRKVSGKFAADVKITVNVADYGLAQPGDSLKVNGWQYGEQAIIAQSVEVELANPLAPRRRPTATPRPAPNATNPAPFGEQKTEPPKSN